MSPATSGGPADSWREPGSPGAPPIERCSACCHDGFSSLKSLTRRRPSRCDREGPSPTAGSRSPAAGRSPAGVRCLSMETRPTTLDGVRSAQRRPDRARADATRGGLHVSRDRPGRRFGASHQAPPGSPGQRPRWPRWRTGITTWSSWSTAGPGSARLNDQLTAVLARRGAKGTRTIRSLELMHGGRWLGHPLHPALSDLPIGFWAGSMLLGPDRRRPRPPKAASTRQACSPRPAIAAAVATRGPPGVVDWTVSDDQDRRVGLVSTGCSTRPPWGCRACRWAARLVGHRGTRPAGLGAAGLAVTGGRRLPRRSPGVRQGRDGQPGGGGPTGPRRWVRVIEESELPDDVPAGVAGRRTAGPAVPARRNPLRARQTSAAHAAGLLSRGAVEGPDRGPARCTDRSTAWADGSVRRGPSHQPQPVIRSRVRNGWIEVRGNQPRPRAGPPTEGSSHGL